MAAPPAKKKKTGDNKNRKFHDEWRLDFFFTLPHGSNVKPTCLICGLTVSMVKKHDIQRHYNTHKIAFEENYPPGSEARKKKLESLMKSYEGSSRLMVRTATQQEKTTEVSLRVSWILNKNKLPFTVSEVFKECIVETGKVICPEKVETFEKIPLSNDTNTRRTELMADIVKEELLEKIKKARNISLAIDESTDVTDMAQLAMFVRFLDEDTNTFREELLAVLPLPGTTKGEDIFNAIQRFFDTNKIPMDKVASLLTDGAPAMTGRNAGVAARMKAVCPGLISFHCIIHNAVLCAKLNGENGELSETLKKLVEIVNFLRAKSSTQHRDLRSFLEEEEACYYDIPLHTAVRWLSKGQVLKRMWTLRPHIILYLEQSVQNRASEYHDFMNNTDAMMIVAFLVDIFSHLNDLNLQLQGKNKSLSACRKAVKAFAAMLLVYKDDMQNDMAHFPTLKNYLQHLRTEQDEFEPDIEIFVDFVDKLISEFESRFTAFKNLDDLLLVVTQPFLVNAMDKSYQNQAQTAVPHLSPVNIQKDLIGIQADDELKLQFNNYDLEKFWIYLHPCELRTMALHILTIFGSTYICEQCFSNINFIKNKHRNRLTNKHLDNIVRIATTSFKAVARSGKCNFSH